jgi:hypothetical protein
MTMDIHDGHLVRLIHGHGHGAIHLHLGEEQVAGG